MNDSEVIRYSYFYSGIIYNSAQNVVRLCRSYPYDICYLLKYYSIRGVRFLPL